MLAEMLRGEMFSSVCDEYADLRLVNGPSSEGEARPTSDS